MSTDQVKRNEETYRAVIARVWNQPEADWDFLRASLSPKYMGVDATFPRADVDAGVQVQKDFRAAFKDVHYEVISVFGEGDQICARWTLTGTFVGPLLGYSAPAGQAIVIEGISVNRFDGEGRILQGWISADYLQFFKQAGLTHFNALRV